MSAVLPVPGRLATPGLKRPGAAPVLVTLSLLLMVAMVWAAGSGPFAIAPREVLAMLLHAAGIHTGIGFTPQQEAVLFAIRLPRILMGVLVGAGLAAAGAAMQGLFRNPLADPGLIGVSSGAALAAAFIIVMGATVLPGLSRALGIFTLPLAAFLGGLGITILIYSLSSRDGRISLPVMLLAGIAVNALAGAGIGLFTYIATDDQLRTLTFWSLGSLAGSGWPAISICAPCVVLAVALACRSAHPLNAILLGEAEAGHLGVDVRRLKGGVIVLTALSVGVLVAFTGIIGFVGLIAPHMLRLIAGPDHRVVIPGAALLGATLAVLADTVARTAAAPAEMPIGILTALIGAPFFLGLLLKQRRAWGA